MSARATVLEVRDLQAEYAVRRGAVRAVRGVTFSLARDERLGIVGESGSGKSALALSVMGLLEPPGRIVSGSVLLHGRDLRRLSDRELSSVRGKNLSMIFQDPSGALDPLKTIGDQLSRSLLLHKTVENRRLARRRAAELLRDVEIPTADRRLDDYPHQYSGGMKQRVMIAMALANEPDVVIADEPTTALDVTTQAQVLDLLDRLVAERGAAVIFITHNLGVVAEFCTSVQVMYAGRFVERRSVLELFKFPAHPYTRALLEAVPRRDSETLSAVAGAPPDMIGISDTACAFAPRCVIAQKRCFETAPILAPISTAADGEVECFFPYGRNSVSVG